MPIKMYCKHFLLRVMKFYLSSYYLPVAFTPIQFSLWAILTKNLGSSGYQGFNHFGSSNHIDSFELNQQLCAI